MAVDKVVDSTQLNSDLTSVANAIRTKGGTSGSLAFPSGFVSAIEDISGGGDIYDGSYTVDPTFNSQTIPTKDKTMANDISVSAIEVNYVSNPFGGNTVYIGG